MTRGPAKPISAPGSARLRSPRSAVLAATDYLSPYISLALFPVDAAPAAEKAATVVVADAAYDVWQGNYSPNGRWKGGPAISQGLPGNRSGAATATTMMMARTTRPTTAPLFRR